jgi:hypothetical protein
LGLGLQFPRHDEAPGSLNLGVQGEALPECPKPRWLDRDVIVGEGNYIAGSRVDPSIPGSRDPGSRFHQDVHSRVTRKVRQRTFRIPSIVHHENLNSRIVKGSERVNGAFEFELIDRDGGDNDRD